MKRLIVALAVAAALAVGAAPTAAAIPDDVLAPVENVSDGLKDGR
jgi:hypothetical protein